MPGIGVVEQTNLRNCMKKLFLIASLVLACAGMGFAQTKKPKADGAKKTTATAKPAATATTKPAAAAAGPTKKDGTADMRYKANKNAAAKPATTHLKKDGTPDKRFKENKTTKKS
jgi:hypothetical protein